VGLVGLCPTLKAEPKGSESDLKDLSVVCSQPRGNATVDGIIYGAPVALIKCKECGREVSDRAPTCPNCGAPIAGAAPTKVVVKRSGGCGLFLIIVFAIIAAVVLLALGL
jgi:hypothetical protein